MDENEKNLPHATPADYVPPPVYLQRLDYLTDPEAGTAEGK